MVVLPLAEDKAVCIVLCYSILETAAAGARWEDQSSERSQAESGCIQGAAGCGGRNQPKNQAADVNLIGEST
jgi:hypothetical protein